jgi:hypothetical protein
LDERWVSWKDESGWTVKLEFTAAEVEHDARWSFDPRRSTLSPINADATQLSRQGSLPEGLIPRLRAVDTERVSPYKDDSRFDSGAFGPRLLPDPEEPAPEVAVVFEQPEHSSAAVQEAAARRAPEESHPGAETADLLEALRRRRGQRETAPLFDAEEHDESDESSPIALFDALEEESDPAPTPPEPEPAESASGRRKRRSALPSWDEIVFGARTDE